MFTERMLFDHVRLEGNGSMVGRCTQIDGSMEGRCTQRDGSMEGRYTQRDGGKRRLDTAVETPRRDRDFKADMVVATKNVGHYSVIQT